MTQTPAISAGDTAWVLASSALVLLMTVGLACFYSGLVRSKNSLNTMMMSIVAMGAIGVLWIVVGYDDGQQELTTAPCYASQLGHSAAQMS